MAIVRLSPGVYRDSVTGKTIKSATGQAPMATKPKTPVQQQQQVQQQQVQQPAATTNPDLLGLQDKRKKIIANIQAKGGKASAPGYTQILSDLDKRIKGLRAQPAGVAGTGGNITPNLDVDPSPLNKTPVDTTTSEPQTAGPSAIDTSSPVWDMLFKPTKGFDENADYVRAKEKGMNDMAKMAAARGLVGSGAEVGGTAEFLSGLNAQESNRINEYNNIAADRLHQILTEQASLSEGARKTNLEFLAEMLGIGSEQNPAQLGLNAAGSTSDLIEKNAKNKEGYVATDYKKSYPSGGGAAPSYVPPSLTSTPINGSSILGQVMGYNADTAGLNAITGGLGSLFNALRR